MKTEEVLEGTEIKENLWNNMTCDENIMPEKMWWWKGGEKYKLIWNFGINVMKARITELVVNVRTAYEKGAMSCIAV